MSVLGELFRFRSQADRPREGAADQVRAWARAILDCPADAVVKANEIACLDPGCPGVETVILILAPGERTRAYKVAKAIGEVTEQDLRQALV